MKVLIVEDELGVAQNLCDLLMETSHEIEILAIIESVKDAVYWLSTNPPPDLGFFDIRIADGDSFDIFRQTDIQFPVIFTTAYDEYALRAFKVNSVDYLLKPIGKNELEAALSKYESIYKSKKVGNNELLSLIQKIQKTQPQTYKNNLLVYVRDKILPIAVEKIAYFYLEKQLVHCVTHQNEKFVIEQSLDKIELQLNPNSFFRANRQFIVSRMSINSATQHFHRKLKLDLSPAAKEEVLISKLKASHFKKWLEM